MIEQIIAGKISEEEIKRFLLDLKARGETSEDLANAARALLKAATPFPRPDYEFADLVGTGGDEQGTLNISTAAAFVVAQMGLPVAKHGNKSVSSKCGSADVLVSLGADLELLPEKSRDCLDKLDFCFLLAPVYHPGMRYAAAARKALATRTIFNLLGPLVNPARPPIQLTGVYDPKLCRPMAETFQKLGSKSALVVHGSGLDEIAIHGPTQAVLLKDGEISEFVLHPIHTEPLESIRGGDPEENAAWLVRILKGQATEAQNQAVALNAAGLMFLTGESFRMRFDQALETILSGKAYDKLDAFITYTRS
ncbi:MAG: anthranilate phosphoribosyltransferase [Myxococcaceae bacterium]